MSFDYKTDGQNFESNVDSVENKIKNFKEKQNKKKQILNNNDSNISYMYNICADLFAGVLTAFILNKIYTFFFQKNIAVFFLLLLLCTIAGLYNAIRMNKKNM